MHRSTWYIILEEDRAVNIQKKSLRPNPRLPEKSLEMITTNHISITTEILRKTKAKRPLHITSAIQNLPRINPGKNTPDMMTQKTQRTSSQSTNTINGTGTTPPNADTFKNTYSLSIRAERSKSMAEPKRKQNKVSVRRKSTIR